MKKLSLLALLVLAIPLVMAITLPPQQMPKVAGLGTQFMIGTRVWCDPIRDDWSSYTNGADLDTQNGGCGFEQPYADRPNFPYVNAYDNLTNYSNGASLNGLNSGYGWKVGGISQPYVDKSL